MPKFAELFASNASGIRVASAYSILGPINKFDDVFISLTPPIEPTKQLAAEQVVHLMDGWRYGASAIAALLRNSPNEAIHFAYYAELRAAMSLYSGSGIRLEQRDNYYVDNTGTKFPQHAKKNEERQLHTHTIAWDLWNKWITRPDAQDLVLDGIRLAPSVSLRELAPVLALFNTSRTIGTWGYDLISQPKADRSERNNASYKARYASETLTKMEERDLNIVLTLCRMLLPAQSGLTNSLAFDTALIQYLALATIESKVPDNETNRLIRVEEEKVKFINQLSSNTGQPKEFINELFTIVDPAIIDVFKLAAEKASAPYNVLCRAIFMLRLASLSVEKNIHNASTSAVSDWLINWLDYSGIRSRDADFDPPDLSADYENAIEQHAARKFTYLPNDLWTPENAANSYMLSRPDYSVGWSILR